jgi:hypothetical protein
LSWVFVDQLLDCVFKLFFVVSHFHCHIPLFICMVNGVLSKEFLLFTSILISGSMVVGFQRLMARVYVSLNNSCPTSSLSGSCSFFVLGSSFQSNSRPKQFSDKRSSCPLGRWSRR